MTSALIENEVFVSVPDGKIYVKTWTPKKATNKTPIVLFHDSLGCVETWRDFPAELASQTERQVIAYDRLGFGKSSARINLPSFDFILEESEIYLPLLLNELKIEKFIAAGHSVGGGMSLIAASHMKNITAIITESAQAFVEDRTLNGVRTSKTAFQDPSRLDKLKKYHGEKSRWVVDAWTEIWLDKKFKDWSLKPYLQKVTCPTLIIHGDKDEYGSVQFPEMIFSEIQGPKEIHILEGFGHVPHKENQDLILKLITNFLFKHPSI